MPKAAKGPAFYAVHKGRVPGVYLTWAECENQTKGISGAKYQKFATAAEAHAFVGGSSASTSTSTSTSTAGSSAHAQKPYAKPATPQFNAFAAAAAPDEAAWDDVVYTDGGCKGNGRQGSVAGVGVWFGHDDERNISERCPGDQTNNRAELVAIARALETMPLTKRKLLIKTDSKYCIQSFEDWLPNWVRRGWMTASGTPVANAPLIRYVSALLDERGQCGQKVGLKHVYGHRGTTGNEGADQLATAGCYKPEAPERDWDALAARVKARAREVVRVGEGQEGEGEGEGEGQEQGTETGTGARSPGLVRSTGGAVQAQAQVQARAMSTIAAQSARAGPSTPPVPVPMPTPRRAPAAAAAASPSPTRARASSSARALATPIRPAPAPARAPAPAPAFAFPPTPPARPAARVHAARAEIAEWEWAQAAEDLLDEEEVAAMAARGEFD